MIDTEGSPHRLVHEYFLRRCQGQPPDGFESVPLVYIGFNSLSMA